MDFLTFTDDLSGILEAIQEIKLLGEDGLNLENFSNNLFQLIGLYLRRNTNLKAIISFIKSLEKKPEVAILIQNYSYTSENILTNSPPFLQNFNVKNYEYIMVIGKLNKMIEKFKIDSKFTKALKKSHIDAKMSIYFEIPCFPKDLNFLKKAESLQLKQIGQNIIHEIVRRQKWKKCNQIFRMVFCCRFLRKLHHFLEFQNSSILGSSIIFQQLLFIIKCYFLIIQSILRYVYWKCSNQRQRRQDKIIRYQIKYKKIITFLMDERVKGISKKYFTLCNFKSKFNNE